MKSHLKQMSVFKKLNAFFFYSTLCFYLPISPTIIQCLYLPSHSMPTVLFRLRPCPAAAKHHSHVKLLHRCADAKWHGASLSHWYYMKIQQWPLRHVRSVKLAWFCSHLYFYISKIWQLFHVPSMITMTLKLQNDITSSCHITSETWNSQMTLFSMCTFFFSFYI